MHVDFPERDFVIVSGVSNVGVPAQAYAAATVLGYRTGGVACEKAAGFEWFPLTEEPIIAGKAWGDESSVFTDGISALERVDPSKVARYAGHPHYGLDAMIRIGMGAQSLRETVRIRDQGKPVYEYDLPRLA